MRTLDVIHVSTALYIGAGELIAYDRRLLAAAQAQGITVAVPGLNGSTAPPRPERTER